MRSINVLKLVVLMLTARLERVNATEDPDYLYFRRQVLAMCLATTPSCLFIEAEKFQLFFQR
jgi:hypothetical protein